MSNEYPTFYARFYDLIYSQQRDGIDNDFFINEIERTKGKVLEIGVGTGRLFANAINRGADIYGLDISQAMIEVLLAKLRENQTYRISLQNIIDFNFDFKFDLVIAPFHVFMHLLEKEDQLKAINNVYRHLNHNGRFIFDAFIPNLNQLTKGIDDLTDFQSDYEPGKKIKRIISTKPDLINQIINITFRFVWDEDNEEKMEEWRTPLRYFFRYELEHLVERSDFEKHKIIGDYNGNDLNENSKEFIVICRKQ